MTESLDKAEPRQMKDTKRHLALQYALAVGSVLLALGVRLILAPLLGTGAPFLVFVIATIVTAYFARRGPAILATLLGVVAADYFFMPPLRSFGFWRIDNAIWELLFLLTCAAIIAVVEGQRKQRVRAEEALREVGKNEQALQRERYVLDGIMEATDVMLVYLDTDFNFVAVNRAYAQTCHKPPEEMIGKNHFEFYPHPENEAIFRRVRDTGEPVFYKDKPFEFPDQPERGVTYWDWSLTAVKGVAGKVEGLVFSLRETTKYRHAEKALRESEERYCNLFESMDEGFASCEMIYDEAGQPIDFRYLAVNPAFEKLTGLSAQQVIGRRVREVIPQIEPFWIETYDRIVRTGNSERIDNHVASLGKHFELFAWCSGPGRFAVVFNDVTERKQAEERLRQAQKLESVGMLAGGIAHDFNNLLVGVIGNASLAQDMLPPGYPAAELLDEVVKTGEQAAHLTRQMLAYAGKGQFLLEPLNLSDLIPEIMGLVQPSVSKKIALHLELEADLPCIQADQGQMQQVFMNLVLNAAEAIGSDAGMISIKTGAQDVNGEYIRRHLQGAELRPGRYVCLEVRDTGCGMDEATKAKVFDPFFSTKFQGRGLGLAAVAGIVRGHKGAITVNSTRGKGTCFTVLLPAVEGAASVLPVTARDAALHGTGTILVVDDEEMVRRMAQRALERYGYKVLLADSGPAAIDLFKRHPGDISLVILDASMPGMSGEETFPELHKIRPEVKVLISSGYSETDTMRSFPGPRVAGFIQKPYTLRRLAETVKSAIS